MKRVTLLQVIPRPPDDCGGVGDYARQLAGRLQERHGIDSTFLSAAPVGPGKTVDGFDVQGPFRTLAQDLAPPGALLLHYVNYGYNPRGVPHWLPGALRPLVESGGARLITIFHEVYAAGSWRQSAFWLRPLQKQIARSLADISATLIVSNETQRAQLKQLSPHAHIMVQPVMSNFGEPLLSPSELASRDPHRWLICGGNELLARSIRSFIKNLPRFPAPCSPGELLIVGGSDQAELRAMLKQVKGVQTHYHPQVAPEEAARLLSSCAFAWIDYFHEAGVASSTILKSTVFAAFCAHGVIPVFPRDGAPVSLGSDTLPGPFFVAPSGQKLPADSERSALAHSFHEWYRRNSSSEHLAELVAEAISPAA